MGIYKREALNAFVDARCSTKNKGGTRWHYHHVLDKFEIDQSRDWNLVKDLKDVIPFHQKQLEIRKIDPKNPNLSKAAADIINSDPSAEEINDLFDVERDGDEWIAFRTHWKKDGSEKQADSRKGNGPSRKQIENYIPTEIVLGAVTKVSNIRKASLEARLDMIRSRDNELYWWQYDVLYRCMILAKKMLRTDFCEARFANVTMSDNVVWKDNAFHVALSNKTNREVSAEVEDESVLKDIGLLIKIRESLGQDHLFCRKGSGGHLISGDITKNLKIEIRSCGIDADIGVQLMRTYCATDANYDAHNYKQVSEMADKMDHGVEIHLRSYDKRSDIRKDLDTSPLEDPSSDIAREIIQLAFPGTKLRDLKIVKIESLAITLSPTLENTDIYHTISAAGCKYGDIVIYVNSKRSYRRVR